MPGIKQIYLYTLMHTAQLKILLGNLESLEVQDYY